MPSPAPLVQTLLRRIALGLAPSGPLALAQIKLTVSALAVHPPGQHGAQPVPGAVRQLPGEEGNLRTCIST